MARPLVRLQDMPRPRVRDLDDPTPLADQSRPKPNRPAWKESWARAISLTLMSPIARLAPVHASNGCELAA